MTLPKVSVLIPSWQRPATLTRCLTALASQTHLPDEVLVVWQDEDDATRDAAEKLKAEVPFELKLIYSAQRGVVPAENAALAQASSGIIILIDDDAVAPPGWLARHLAFYADPTVGAVGGPADSFRPDGTRFPLRAVEPVGTMTWCGAVHGNMYDQVPEWRQRPPRDVVHLVGYNMSLRRSALDHFEPGLRPYWQFFELDACLQVRERGFRVVFDFGNVVEHHPTNATYAGGREGDLTTKVFNVAFNYGLILGKHLSFWRLLPAIVRQVVVGRMNSPGFMAATLGVWRYGRPLRELGILRRSMAAFFAGVCSGRRRRSSLRASV